MFLYLIMSIENWTILGVITTIVCTIATIIGVNLTRKSNKNASLQQNNAAEIEKQKLKLSVKPIIKTMGSRVRGYDGLLQIQIVNKGKRAKLIETNVISEGIELQQINAHLPYDFEEGNSRWLFFESINGVNPNDASYEVHLIYTDEINTKYKTTIKGTGGNCKIIATEDY